MNKEIKSQEWIDKEYPIDGYSNDSRYRHPNPKNLFEFNSNYWKKRSEIISLNISTFLKLTSGNIGDPESVKISETLDLTTFSNLKYLDISGNHITFLRVPSSLETLYCSSNFLSSLNLNHCTKLKTLGCVKNQITNLDLKNNPLLWWLYCYENKLKTLDLSQNRNLAILDCHNNKLEEIILNNEQKLKKIKLSDNLLTYFPYESVNSKTLKEIYLSNNNLEKTNISIFKNFIELEKLWIGNTDIKKIENDVYNRFYGSFESLKDLKLIALAVDNTDIDHGSRYLPNSIEVWGFLVSGRPNCKLSELEQINDYYLCKNFDWNYNECFNFEIQEEFLKSEKVTKEKLERQLFNEKRRLVIAERNLWKRTFGLSEKDLDDNLENWKGMNFYKIFTPESFNEVKRWLDLGFYFEEFFLVKSWKENISFEKTKFLLSRNLLKKDQWKVAFYWSNFYNRRIDEFNLYELKVLKEGGFVANCWMDVFYPKDKRSECWKIEINNQFLFGELDLTDFTKLRWIDCSNNNLSKLIINSNLNLNCFNYSGNQNLEVFYLDDKKSIILDKNYLNISSLWKRTFQKLEKFNLSYNSIIDERQRLLIEE